MSLAKNFLKDSLIYTIPGFISRGLGLILLPIYTRILSPTDYGVLELFVVLAAFVGLTVALEVSQAVARFYVDTDVLEEKRAYASTGLWFSMFCYSLFVVGGWIWAEPLSVLITEQSSYIDAFRLSIIYTFLKGLFTLVQNQLRWELRSREYAIVSVVMTVVTAVATIGFGYGLRLELEGILIGMIAGVLVGDALALIMLRNTFCLTVRFCKLREMLSFSAPLVLSGIFIFLSTYSDRLMITHLMTLDDVGSYAVGYRIASVAGLLMIGFRGALTPLVIKYHNAPETAAELANIVRYFMAFALVIFLGASFFGREVLWLITTPEYYEAYAVIPFLVLSTLLAGMYIFAPGIFIAKKTHWIIWINLTAALLNILLNIFLIPLLGIMGAALATFTSNAVAFSSYMTLSQKFYPVRHKWKRIGNIALLSFLLAMGGGLIKTISLTIFLVKAVALCAFLYLLIRIIIPEAKEVKNIFRNL
jgi:O-antigen/teichoic acid export membrane protein